MYFLVHGILLSLTFSGLFLVGIDESTFHPDFCEDTGQVLLVPSCHGLGNDLSRTFRRTNTAQINQYPLTFLSYFWHPTFCSNLSFSSMWTKLSSYFPSVSQSFYIIFSVASKSRPLSSYAPWLAFKELTSHIFIYPFLFSYFDSTINAN